MAPPRLKTQLEIGKEYNDTPWGKKNEYAACSPYAQEILRRYAQKYRESLRKGTIRGKVVGVNELKTKSRVMKENTRVLFKESEAKLVDKFTELRKVGIPVNGPYLKAKMLKYVKKEENQKKEKIQNFKASDTWLKGFCERHGISVRVQTNKKSKSAFKRSRMVRNFHWFMIYKAPLSYSDRKSS